MIWTLVAAALLAQQVSTTRAVKAPVEGRVINSLNGEAVRKATVILRAHDQDHGPSYADETDANGHFSIDDVESGEYAVFAERPGFMMQSTGATGAPPPSIKIEKGQNIADLTIRLTPLGVIAGRVLDADGDPVRGATVRALRYSYVAGKKELTNAEQVQSGDNGEFRLFGLRAGTFYLKATHFRRGSGWPPASVSTYYPGASDESHAAPVMLRAGAQLRGFDIRLQATSGYTIRVESSEAERTNSRFPVFLLNKEGFANQGGAIFFSSNIVFSGVPPGWYEVLAIRQPEGEKPRYARLAVEVVNADVDGGTLNFLPAADISGSVRVEGGAAKGFEGLRVDLRQTRPTPMMGSSSAEVKPDGSFLLKDVPPGAHELAIAGKAGLYLKSLRLGDKQLTDWRIDVTSKLEGLVIVLGADMGELEGSVQNGKGEPVLRARVNAIAYGDQASRTDFNRFAFTDEKGEFKIKDVAPGEYKIFAWEDVPVGAPQDPEFRKPFEKRAVSVKMQPNGHEKVQVTAIAAAATKIEDQ
jgi:uncharacterized GH25 family protein